MCFKKSFFVFFSLFLSIYSFSQNIVKGKVIDEGGNSIPFVNVYVKNGSEGTVTSEEGDYELKVEKGGVLVFSALGYETKEVVVADKNLINVTLKESVDQLGEVVVVGYGTVKKSDLTGSVAVLDKEALTKFPVSNIGSAMQGQLSGVQVVNSSEPGRNPQVLVRGFGTIYGDANPLVIIDGLQTGVGALSRIDPASVESMQVLKDASAAAIYGSRAANGVIIISTKKGSEGFKEINYSLESGVSFASNRFDLMNTTQYAEYTSKLYVNSSTPLVQRDPPAWTQNPDVLAVNTDWQDVMFKPAFLQKHNLSFSGGGSNSTYFLGLGYLNQEGIIENSSFERVNLQINSQATFKRLTIGESINLFNTQKPETDLTSNAERLYEVAPQIAPYDPLNENGLGAPYPDVTGGNNQANPLAYRYRSIETKTYGALGNIFGEYELVKGLKFRTDFNFEVNSIAFERYREPTFQSQSAITRTDYEILVREANSSSINSEFLLKYSNKFDKHSIDALIGYTVVNNKTRSVEASANNVEPGTRVPQTGQNIQGASNFFESRLVSQLARVNYSYNNKYLFTGSIRRDGSSNFGANNRYGIFPSFSLGWQLGEEDFMKDIQWITSLKLRGGYGELGRTLGSFLATLNPDVRYPWPTGIVQGVSPTSVPNDELKWETVKQINIGFDLSLFQNKLQISTDFYNRKSEDMIIRVPLPQFTGIAELPWYNLGSMVNRGVEVEATYKRFENDNFNHQIKANFTYNQNELISLNNADDVLLTEGTITKKGEPLASHYGWLTEGINPTNGAMIFKDVNEDGRIDGDDRVVLGSPHPDFIFGLNYSLNYKNFDFSLFFQGVAGNEILNSSRISLESTHSDRNRLASVLTNAYDPNTNPNGSLPIISLRNENDNDRISDRFIEKGDYIRLRNIQLGYKFPENYFSNSVKDIRLYASVINAFTITSYSGLDPDINNNGSVFNLGNDRFRYPPLRSFNFGIQVSF